MKDHYNMNKREQSLIDYWNSQAKKGNKNAKDVLDFRDYLKERESRIVGLSRRVCLMLIVSRPISTRDHQVQPSPNICWVLMGGKMLKNNIISFLRGYLRYLRGKLNEIRRR